MLVYSKTLHFDLVIQTVKSLYRQRRSYEFCTDSIGQLNNLIKIHVQMFQVMNMCCMLFIYQQTQNLKPLTNF